MDNCKNCGHRITDTKEIGTLKLKFIGLKFYEKPFVIKETMHLFEEKEHLVLAKQCFCGCVNPVPEAKKK